VGEGGQERALREELSKSSCMPVEHDSLDSAVLWRALDQVGPPSFDLGLVDCKVDGEAVEHHHAAELLVEDVEELLVALGQAILE